MSQSEHVAITTAHNPYGVVGHRLNGESWGDGQNPAPHSSSFVIIIVGAFLGTPLLFVTFAPFEVLAKLP